MGGLSLWGQKKVGDHILRVATFDPLAAGPFMSLHLADPTDAGLTTDEISTSGTNYARFDLSGIMSAVDLSTGIATLIGNVNIGPALIDWGLIAFVGFWDGADPTDPSVHMIFSGGLSTAQLIVQDGQFQLLAGQFQVKID